MWQTKLRVSKLMATYFLRHLQVLFATLGDMRRTPMSSLNTLMIVAITLLLPCLLYIGIKSAEQLSGSWQGRPQASIFLSKELGSPEAQLIFDEIRLHPAVQLAEFVTPKQALEEFKLLSKGDNPNFNLDAEIEFLGGNPLPPSIVIMPDEASADSSSLLELKDQLSKIEGIESIRLDLDWTDRFNAILKLFTRVAGLLSALLAVALILIVSNTIKLLIVNRRQEIEITKLVGASDAFVRRPFLYYGSLNGLIGALICLGLLVLGAGFVNEPLGQLGSLYQSTTFIYHLSSLEIVIVLGIGTALGWLAARWSVAQHLRRIQPR